MSFLGLMNDYVEKCVFLEKSRVPDGEGGWVSVWADGMEFDAAITYENTTEARLAESQGMTAKYIVTTDKTMPLDYHDVFRRVSDGQVFRVKSDATDKKTPSTATFQVCQVSAEEWVLPS